jgi:hypothetical protein
MQAVGKTQRKSDGGGHVGASPSRDAGLYSNAAELPRQSPYQIHGKNRLGCDFLSANIVGT